MKITAVPALKKAFVFLAFCLYAFPGFSKNLPGFIVTPNNDTLTGTVKVSRFDLHDGSFMVNTINLEPLYNSVLFKADQSSRFKSFSPTDIRSFTFHYGNRIYKFESKELEMNSIFYSEQQRNRFLRVVYEGNVSMYENRERISSEGAGRNKTKVILHQYFLYNDRYGLTRLEKTKAYLSLKDILALYITHDDYLSQINVDIQLTDIESVLMQYDRYLLGE